jgi:hypothetical protein
VPLVEPVAAPQISGAALVNKRQERLSFYENADCNCTELNGFLTVSLAGYWGGRTKLRRIIAEQLNAT